jgi:hypothetical protein
MRYAIRGLWYNFQSYTYASSRCLLSTMATGTPRECLITTNLFVRWKLNSRLCYNWDWTASSWTRKSRTAILNTKSRVLDYMTNPLKNLELPESNHISDHPRLNNRPSLRMRYAEPGRRSEGWRAAMSDSIISDIHSRDSLKRTKMKVVKCREHI